MTFHILLIDVVYIVLNKKGLVIQGPVFPTERLVTPWGASAVSTHVYWSQLQRNYQSFALLSLYEGKGK